MILISTLVVSAITSIHAKVYNLTLSKFDASPDGFCSQVLGYNNAMMTPLIFNRGEEAIVNVYNAMDEESSVHYHGLFQVLDLIAHSNDRTEPIITMAL